MPRELGNETPRGRVWLRIDCLEKSEKMSHVFSSTYYLYFPVGVLPQYYDDLLDERASFVCVSCLSRHVPLSSFFCTDRNLKIVNEVISALWVRERLTGRPTNRPTDRLPNH